MSGVPDCPISSAGAIGCYAVHLIPQHQERASQAPTHHHHPPGVLRSSVMKTTERRFLERVEQGPAGCWFWVGGIRAAGYGTFAIKRGKRWTQTTASRVAYQLYVGPIPDGFEVDHLCRSRPCVRPDHLEAIPLAENRRRRDIGYSPVVPRDPIPIPEPPLSPPPTPKPRRDPMICKNGHDKRIVGTVSNGRNGRNGWKRTCAACRTAQYVRKRKGGQHGTETHCPHGHPYEGENIYWQIGPNGSRGRQCRACTLARNRAAYYRRKAILGG